MTKVPVCLQMGKVPQSLVHLCPSKAEAPISFWFPTDEAMEKLPLATTSVAELQAAASNESDLRHILAETTMRETAVPAVGPVLPP